MQKKLMLSDDNQLYVLIVTLGGIQFIGTKKSKIKTSCIKSWDQLAGRKVDHDSIPNQKIASFYVGPNSISELKILSTSHLALGSSNMISKKNVLKKQLHRIITICQISLAQAFKEINDSINIDMLIRIHSKCPDTAMKSGDFEE
jgi:hypothetical protein